MKHANLPTVRVKSPHFAEGVMINKAAFDAGRHQPIEKKEDDRAPVKKNQTSLKSR